MFTYSFTLAWTVMYVFTCLFFLHSTWSSANKTEQFWFCVTPDPCHDHVAFHLHHDDVASRSCCCSFISLNIASVRTYPFVFQNGWLKLRVLQWDSLWNGVHSFRITEQQSLPFCVSESLNSKCSDPFVF